MLEKRDRARKREARLRKHHENAYRARLKQYIRSYSSSARVDRGRAWARILRNNEASEIQKKECSIILILPSMVSSNIDFAGCYSFNDAKDSPSAFPSFGRFIFWKTGGDADIQAVKADWGKLIGSIWEMIAVRDFGKGLGLVF